MSFYESQTGTNDDQNSPFESSRSSRESFVQNVNPDNKRTTATNLPGNLFWRSRSQPPLGVTSHHMSTSCEPGLSITESGQQVSVISHTELDQTSKNSNQVIEAGLSGSTLSVVLNNTNRASIIETPRNSHHRRVLRTARFTQNHDSIPGLLSSSGSNSSLLERFRTITGVNSRPQSIGPSACESHLSRLLRFSSLRFDDTVSDDIEASVRRQESPLGDCSNDEFAKLPVRLGLSYCNFRPATGSSAEEAAVSHSVSTSTSQSQEQPESLPGNTHICCISPVSSSTIISTNSGCDSDDHVGNYSTSAANPSNNDQTNICIPSTPNNCTVKFPKRGVLEHPKSVAGASSSYQPEADHDFYQNSCFSSKTSHKGNDHVHKTYAKLNELRCQGLFCDVVLQSGSVRVPAHRNVLAASSQYFYAMFTGPMTEARSPCVRFHGVEGSALIQLVNFIYTNEINVTEDNVQTLLPAANLLQLTVVRDICCEFLQSQLHPSNCLGIQRFADLHNCQDLLDFTKRFTEQHFGELLKQDDEFLRLNSNQLIELISSDRLAVSEDQVFEAVLRWIAYDPCERQSEAQNLCSYVRFALLPRDYLVRLSQSDTFLSVNPWCKDYLIEALSYHLLPWDQKLRMTSERTKPRTPIGLPKILLVIGGQAPKAIRSIECFEFQGGSWASLSGDSVQIDNSSSPIQLLCNASTSSLSTSNGCSNPMIPVSNWNSDNVCNLIISDLPSRRCRMGVAVLGGLIYVVGGFNGALRVRSVEVYDPLRNTWHSGPNMECRRATLGVAVLNGLIYAVGGFDGTVGLSSAEVLDIWSGCWRPISSMACQRSSVGAGALNGKLFAVGGYDGTVRRCLSSVECYDPVTNSWSMISEMTCRRSGPSVCELNNRLYAVGGHDGPIVQNSAEVFSPETGNWQRIADLNVRRRNAGKLDIKKLVLTIISF
ncbi:Kelch-like protein isoform 3 [Schistosoma japonicum]|uniref:Kelch-like protein isoform 3 n=2 Tax=Schistosoma japonicum TaxID=6182 RepID=A0A4Z2DMT3_SCHJA|nr:Kelch-like protein 2 [Schistosoma japonicum]TNN17759.1 Kelch-like protein isoform 3 [Schistosoma japonicum]